MSSEDNSDDEYAWINYFCSLKGNEYFCHVDEDYIHDGFNLVGLNAQVPYYDFALDVILDVDFDDSNLTDEQQDSIEMQAENLYGLIHARYILTNRGLHAMLEKYRAVQFGRCPRVLCSGQPLLPVGLSDHVKKGSVKLYCPRCDEVYSPRTSRSENVDGAYFGTTFAHLFFLVYPELRPDKSSETYIPKVFGFQLHSTSHQRSLESSRRAQTNRATIQNSRKP